MMQLGRYIRTQFQGRQIAFARKLAEHPLMNYTSARNISVTISQINKGDVKKPAFLMMAAIDDITNGAVTWSDWLEVAAPAWVKTRRRP